MLFIFLAVIGVLLVFFCTYSFCSIYVYDIDVQVHGMCRVLCGLKPLFGHEYCIMK